MRTLGATGLVLSLLLVVGGCSVWHEHEASKWSDTTGGESLERMFWKDVKAKNWTELSRHFAGNFTAYTPEEGRFDRATMQEHLQQLQLDDYSLGDMQTELSGTTFVVTYTITMRGTFAGQPLPTAPIRMMSVWQEQKRNWVMIAHSVIGQAGK